jgi:hypothetical protein
MNTQKYIRLIFKQLQKHTAYKTVGNCNINAHNMSKIVDNSFISKTYNIHTNN